MMTLKERKKIVDEKHRSIKIIDIIFKEIAVNGSFIGIEQTLDKVMINNCQ